MRKELGLECKRFKHGKEKKNKKEKDKEWNGIEMRGTKESNREMKCTRENGNKGGDLVKNRAEKSKVNGKDAAKEMKKRRKKK